ASHLLARSRLRSRIPLKIRHVSGLLRRKSDVDQRPPAGAVRKFGEGGASSGVVHVI
ncbi:hypothetical protein AVEN_90893-1, partial [Araneus ventricosus]